MLALDLSGTGAERPGLDRLGRIGPAILDVRLTRPAAAAAFFLSIATLAAPALANDSSAEMAAGGLVLVKNPNIEMRSEDLFISAEAVRVRYVFFNSAPQDVTVRVAFPMPDVTTNGYDDIITVPTEDPQNLLGFSTRVDGRPVAAEVEQKVFAGGVDRTALLQSLHVPLAPHLKGAGEALDALPQARRDELVKLGLAVVDEYDAGKGWEKHWAPTWTLKTTYHWQQTFPAGRPMVVEHSYTPAVGGSAGTIVGAAPQADDPEMKAYRRKYCLEDDIVAAVRRRIPKGQDYPPFSEQRIGYVLTTGANWKAPIGQFHLTIDKGKADNLVSFCADGVKKTGPTRFEVSTTAFTPTQDLNILILVPYPPQ